MNNTDVKNTVVSNEHDLIIYQDGAIGRFHLNRPAALNALTAPMAYKMKDQLHAWAVDDSIKAILIDAEGDRAFCAGGDIRDLYENGKKDPKPGQDFWREEYKLNALINNFPKPYIAYMNGIVMGGGVGISSHGSHRIVTENTMLAMPETGIGFLPDVGGTYILSRSPGLTGLYLGMTGARMNAADAIFAGFADHFIPSDKLPLLTEKLINGANLDAAIAELASNAPDGTLAGLQADITEAFSGATALECTQKITAMAE
ncbi:MAG: 3-hydroxyisobutyryl-CoA hydrolase, partial [Rhodomicrobiaceae bacterium]